jgi:hypothetical protein
MEWNLCACGVHHRLKLARYCHACLPRTRKAALDISHQESGLREHAGTRYGFRGIRSMHALVTAAWCRRSLVPKAEWLLEADRCALTAGIRNAGPGWWSNSTEAPRWRVVGKLATRRARRWALRSRCPGSPLLCCFAATGVDYHPRLGMPGVSGSQNMILVNGSVNDARVSAPHPFITRCFVSINQVSAMRASVEPFTLDHLY